MNKKFKIFKRKEDLRYVSFIRETNCQIHFIETNPMNHSLPHFNLIHSPREKPEEVVYLQNNARPLKVADN